MKLGDFKSHTIKRSAPKYKKDYKECLRHDFSGRCAYCNILDEQITTCFEIDHFIPRKAFEGKRDTLYDDYRNLIYSCKKCNLAKRNQFEGDIFSDPPKNNLFYDPVEVDYNTIFYRNELGAIASDDEKGRDMIKRLRLYRPVHILAWLCEKIDTTADKLENAIKLEQDCERKKQLKNALDSFNSQYRKYNKFFNAAYKDDSFLSINL